MNEFILAVWLSAIPYPVITVEMPTLEMCEAKALSINSEESVSDLKAKCLTKTDLYAIK